MSRNILRKIRFDEFVAKIYLPNAKIRKRSWKVDERIARQHLSPVFGDKFLSSITSLDISKWQASLLDHPYAPATCNRILAVLRVILNMAVKYGFLSSSPCADVSSFRLYNQRANFLKIDDAKKIMKELAKSPHPYALALMLLLLTGARKNEILHARWEHVDIKRKIIHVPLSKSGRCRTIYLCDEALSIISELPSYGQSSWLFPGRKKDKPVCDIYRFWNQLRSSLGLQTIRIHDLRHTYASILVNCGHTLYEVQKLLGHAEPKTTMRYAHLSHDSLGQATQTIGRLFFTENKYNEIPYDYCGILRLLAAVPWMSIVRILENAG